MKLNGMIIWHITRGKFSEIILNSELHGGKSQMLEDVTGIPADHKMATVGEVPLLENQEVDPRSLPFAFPACRVFRYVEPI